MPICRGINIPSITNIDRYANINAPNAGKLSHKYYVHFTSLTIIPTLENPDFFLQSPDKLEFTSVSYSFQIWLHMLP